VLGQDESGLRNFLASLAFRRGVRFDDSEMRLYFDVVMEAPFFGIGGWRFVELFVRDQSGNGGREDCLAAGLQPRPEEPGQIENDE
jgi:hypothetical protein